MKKIILFIISISCLFLTSCKSNITKDIATIEKFNEAATNNGLIVRDNKASYLNVEYVKEASIAEFENITIEMIIYDNEENTNLVQENHIKNFNMLKSTGASEIKDKGNNYYKYSLISNGYYMISSRVENTLIFSKTTLENKDKVIAILEKLGY